MSLHPCGGGDDDQPDSEEQEGQLQDPGGKLERLLHNLGDLQDAPGNGQVSDEDLGDARLLHARPEAGRAGTFRMGQWASAQGAISRAILADALGFDERPHLIGIWVLA
jgi:hypothetical protein